MTATKEKSSEPRDHKLFWAVGICVASFTFFYTVILPIYGRHEMNLIADQKEQLKKAAMEKQEYQEQLRQAELDNVELRKSLQELRPGFFFQGGPYPEGWESAKIGTPLTTLTTLFQDEDYISDPADDGGYITITPKSPKKDAAITSATYYYDDEAWSKRVTSILFHTTRNRKVKALDQEELIKVFGRADMEKKETKRLVALTWQGVQGICVEIQYRKSFTLAPLIENPTIHLRKR